MTEMPSDIVGSCEFFNAKPFLDAANILVAADEPLRAIQLLDNLPGYYRDHMPLDIYALRSKIYRHLVTPTFYQAEIPLDRESHEVYAQYVQGLLRGKLIEEEVKAFNEKGVTPKVVDLGPGEYWLPLGLRHLGHKFKYKDIGLSQASRDKAYAHLQDHLADPSDASGDIFVACEIIEHLHHEEDIRAEFEKHCPEAKIVHISTPKYTFDGRENQLAWENKGGLGHLRTYTPGEFYNVVSKMFPGFKFKMYDSQILHLRGERV